MPSTLLTDRYYCRTRSSCRQKYRFLVGKNTELSEKPNRCRKYRSIARKIPNSCRKCRILDEKNDIRWKYQIPVGVTGTTAFCRKHRRIVSEDQLSGSYIPLLYLCSCWSQAGRAVRSPPSVLELVHKRHHHTKKRHSWSNRRAEARARRERERRQNKSTARKNDLPDRKHVPRLDSDVNIRCVQFALQG